jgi:hypothetical protein
VERSVPAEAPRFGVGPLVWREGNELAKGRASGGFSLNFGRLIDRFLIDPLAAQFPPNQIADGDSKLPFVLEK